MNGRLEIRDPKALRDYLLTFDPAARQAGERLWREQHVTDLHQTADAADYLEFTATVRDGSVCRVELAHDEQFGWNACCSCFDECFCGHAYAALRELLVRTTTQAALHLGPETQRRVPLVTRVQAIIGRRPKRAEAETLRRVELHYLRVRMAGTLGSWDLRVMGLDPKGMASFAALDLPLIPSDALDFLRLLLWLMAEHKVPIPDFLRPLTLDRDFATRIEECRLAKRIEHWKTVWRSLSTSDLTRGRAEPRTIQLRLRFSAQGAVPEWVPPIRETFYPLKKRDLQEIHDGLSSGEVLLPPGGSLLWSLLGPRCPHGAPLTLNYRLTDDVRDLRRLLLQADCASQLANQAGEALPVSDDPLRWQLTPPAPESAAQYRLQVVHQDGRPPGPLIAVLPGTPTFYLTAQAAYRGPTLPEGSVDWLSEQEIPAAAVECPEGILCLHHLGVPLPEPLERQIRVDPVKVRITCRLLAPHLGTRDEICLFDVVAGSGDKVIRERWTPANSWVRNGTFWPTPAQPEVSQPIVYDRSRQERAVALLAPLRLRPHVDGRPMLKVGKTFAQTFLDWLRTVPPEIPVKLEGELASLARDPLAGRVRLQAKEVSIDWFDIQVVVDAAETELTPEELKLLLAHPGQPIRLPAKGWRRLAFDLTEGEDQQLARLGLSPRELSDEPQRLHALQLADHSARELLPTNQIDAIQRRATEIRARVTPPPPDGLRAVLRPYQSDGFHFLAYLATNHFGGILADDMGLGKTLQALVWLTWLRRTHALAEPDRDPGTGPLPSLVVCPKSVMDNWRAEAERFTPDLRVKVWSSPALSGLAGQLEDAQIHVLNYTQLRLAEEHITPIRWLAVILDEGQFIKNPDSQTAQAARRLQAQHRLVLSGTPIENRLLDLWSLLSFAMPGVLGNRATFQRIYDAAHDPLARQRLAARVRPFLLRRTKSQVARDLPDRVEEDLYCELEGLQRTLYQAELKRARQLLLKVQTNSDLAAQQFNFLTSLLRLRQICCHPALVPGGQRGESAKFGALMDQLEPLMAEGHKVLVFSQFVGLLELLQPQLEARDWPIFRLTGATENRAEVVRSFQNVEGGAIFLLSLKAGSFGLNLTAASYVILFDPWWNPAVENQAIDRTHRIGQNRTVIAYRLLIKNSIEEKVRLLQKQKKALAEDILGEERFAQALTLDDLHFLFSD
jgi:hypothetical protein